MIPIKAKDILLLPVTDGGVTQYFNMPNHTGYDSKKANHNGLDIGYCDHPYCNVLACQDGKVVQIRNNDSSIGNAVTLQHDYADGTHRWTSYIHLKDNPKVKVGQTVKQGEAIGIRGGSPYINGKAKYGVHLHLYVTKATTVAYSWNTLKANVIDPYPYLYRSKAITYDYANATLRALPYMEDVLPNVVEPVKRDESKNQLLEKASNLRVRMTPSLKGTIIGYLKPNVYYNYYDSAEADGYTWHKIAEEQWVAQTSTMTVFPAKTEMESLKEQVASLTAQLATVKSQLTTSASQLEKVEKKNSLLLSKMASIRELTNVD